MKKLAIIGAGYLQLPLVLKAKEMGVATVCFAWEDGAVCREVADEFYPISILEKEKILEVCRQIGIEGITTIATDAAVTTICYIAEKLNLLSNAYTDSLVATDKYLMRQRFAKHKVASPYFEIASESTFEKDFQFPMIVKPTDRSGSRGVTKVWNKAALKNAVERAQQESFTGKAIVEQYVAGNEVSVESISWQGKHYILQITDKVTTGEPYFVELEHHQPSELSAEIQEKIKKETCKALSALNVKYGAGHSELKITEDGEVYLIEVGARMGGDFIGSDLVQLSTGYDFLQGVVQVALGGFEEPQIHARNFSGVYFLCKETEHLLHIFNRKNDKNIVRKEIIDPCLIPIKSSGDRSGYFIYQQNKKLVL